MKMIKIPTEEMAKLKEKEMTDRAIAEYYTEQGKKISVVTVNRRLNEYYASKGQEKPRARRESKAKKIDISTEEMVKLKEKGISDKAIAEYYTSQGKSISNQTVNKRLMEYYTSKKQKKPRARRESKAKKIDISTEEMVKLKENGMSDKAIAEYYTNQGKAISCQTVSIRLKKYYVSKGEEKPKAKKRPKKIDMSTEEIVKLKEKGMTDRAIAEYYTEQGKKISVAMINRRLNEYYASKGQEKPRAKRRTKEIDISTEEMVKLKENGMSDKSIAEYYTSQGKAVSASTINRRLSEYYASKGQEKPEVKSGTKKIDISTEEMAKLKEKGMSIKAIAEYYTEQGKKISVAAVNKRLKEYYKSIGKEKPRAKRRTKEIDIPTEEMAKLKEKGISDKAIAEYYTNQGKAISCQTVSIRLKKYYVSKGEEKPKAKKRPKKIDISTEEIVKLKENGMSDKAIAEYYINQGKLISQAAISYASKGEERTKAKSSPKIEDISTEEMAKLKKLLIPENSLDNIIIEALKKGLEIDEVIELDEENRKKIKERIKKIKFIAEHAKQNKSEWMRDEDFLSVISIIENEQSKRVRMKYLPYIKPYLNGKVIDYGKIDTVRNNVFKENNDLMTYVLSSLKLKYGKEYDVHIWNRQKKEYEQKIDKYFSRLHAVEENARKQAKDKKKNTESKTKKETNLSDSDEQR